MLCACKNWRSSMQTIVLGTVNIVQIARAAVDRVALEIRSTSISYESTEILGVLTGNVRPIFIGTDPAILVGPTITRALALHIHSPPFIVVGSLARQSWFGIADLADDAAVVIEYFDPFPNQ